MSTNNSEAVCD